MSAVEPEKRVYKLSVHMERFAQIMRPDRRCQVCLSDENEFNNQKDRLIQCSLCLSTIHQTHYGSELLNSTPLEWHCQRCTYLLKLKDPEINSIACDYCPSRSGIMKQVECEKKKHWIHPECVIWDYPVRFFQNKSFETVKKTVKLHSPADLYWYREFPNRRCRVCHSTDGQFVKCKYYNCDSHYHVTCGRMVGVMRELEKMRVESADVYIPVYCTEHLELRVKDFKQKGDKEKNKEKQKRYIELSSIYQGQLSNLRLSKQYEETLRLRNVVEFTYEDDSKSSESDHQSSSPIAAQREPTQYDSSLCEFLEKELDGCLLNPNPNVFRVVAQIPMDIEPQQAQFDQTKKTNKQIDLNGTFKQSSSGKIVVEPTQNLKVNENEIEVQKQQEQYPSVVAHLENESVSKEEIRGVMIIEEPEVIAGRPNQQVYKSDHNFSDNSSEHL